MGLDTKKEAVRVRQRRYLNKDFEALRNDLLNYAKTFYGDRIRDFSEVSVGGLFLDFAALTGDNFSFYSDHNFGEVYPETATEKKNIEVQLRDAGVEITGNSPATVRPNWYIEVPAEKVGTTYQPKPSSLPIIRQGSVAQADNGTRFELVEDLDFRKKNEDGSFKADIALGDVNANGTPSTLILSLPGDMVSGFVKTETFVIPNTYVPFRKIVLAEEDITDVLSVRDSDNNNYYKVGALSQDTVFRAILNVNSDNELVPSNLEVIPAPYRFTTKMDIDTRLTTLTFGGGTATSLDNDVVPDPSEFAIPLYGKTTFSRFSIDPNKMLQSRTLGVAPQNTTITVQYRYGGGLSHNVPATTIRAPTRLLMSFPENPEASIATTVRASVSLKNNFQAKGGENAPTVDELKSQIPSARNSQARMVTREDVLARIYTMPSSFGRVFRAGVKDNPDNPLSTILYIISRDDQKNLVVSPDSLKKNLVKYLNQFRIQGDAYDILDARVINLQLEFQIGADINANKATLVSNVISKLKKFFDIANFQIDQPIRVDEIRNIIFNTVGVMSLIDLKVKNVVGTINGREYSSNTFNVNSNTKKGMILPPSGGIFELKYPSIDIIGSAV